MSAITNQLARASPSSAILPSSTRRWTYDVFLSFRGKDTRKSFIDHLYFALDQKGIYTFKDDQQLRTGKSITPQLLNAIEESRFAIVVFSENYARSSWCLDELVKIVECYRRMGQTVFPVFYDVDPSDVRRQIGKFGQGFANARHGGKVEKVKDWEEALVEVANFSGWDLRNTANGHESKCIQEIVGHIFSQLNCMSSDGVENLVGIESRMKEVNSMLASGSNDVRIVGIWGMSGIGKTTLARAVFDEISEQFEGSSFLYEVREVSKKQGVEHLQEKLLSETLMLRDLKIRNVYEGINIIKRRLRYKKVLLILDDVDHIDQLDALAGNRDWFGDGSRIIITTKDEHLLVDVGSIYKASVLNDTEATQLFSWKAFKKSKPAEGYEELSSRVVLYACGLPLALKVLGSSLRGRGMREWKSAVERLKDVPEDEILEKLKIGYDGLKNVEKKTFLDIACFFKGEKVDSVTRILDSFGFYPDIGLRILIERSLIDVSYDRIQIHDLIQEMGWHIVRQLHPKEPGRQSRLWLPDDVFHVLTQNMGTEAVEGIVLYLPTVQHVSIGDESFRKMKNLRLLKLRNVFLSQGFEYLSDELRWLDWHGYDSKSLPKNFQASKLVGLKMCRSRIIQLWKGVKIVDKLKFIKLSHSQKLTRTPDFTGMPTLERLVLENCSSLTEIHPSIATHQRLTFLNLKDCKNLKYLPNSIQMVSLKILILSGCTKIGKFPEICGSMGCLLMLYLDGTAIKEIPASIECLPSLVLIDLTNCGNLTSLPSSICNLTGLKFLTLSGCSKLDKLPENLGNLECLEVLRGDRTAITKPPESIVSLKKLKVLSFSGCKGATSDRSWRSLFLSRFRQAKCQNYTSFTLSSVLGFHSLAKLDLSDCHLFDGGIPSDLGCLSSLIELNLSRNHFATVPTSISRLSQLKILTLVGCKRLEAVPKLPANIVKFYADDCTSLKGAEDMLMNYKNLWTVSLTNCIGLFNNMSGMLWQCLLQYISTRRLLQGAAALGKFSVMIPGREIPECFSYQGEGDIISMDLPRNWFNSKFIGFALGIVCKSISATSQWDFIFKHKVPTIYMAMDFINNDQSEKNNIYKISTIGTDQKVESEHVCLVYVSPDSIWSRSERKSSSPNNCSRFKAYFSHSLEEQLLLKRWGVRLVYEEDLEQKGHMMAIDSSSHCGNFVHNHSDRSIEEASDASLKRKRDDDHDNEEIADATVGKRIRDDLHDQQG